MKRENKNNIKVNVDIDKIIDDFFRKFGDVAKSLEVIELRNFILQAINEVKMELIKISLYLIQLKRCF